MAQFNKNLLKKSLKNALNNNTLSYILRDLLWGIIRYKEGNWEDSLERFRGFIEHSHKYLYENLISLTSNPIHLKYDEKTAKNFYRKLKTYIFFNLNIKEIGLIEETRNIYKESAEKFHEIISNGSQSKFLRIIIHCIKLFLLVDEIFNILNIKQLNKLKSIDIEKKYLIFFKYKDSEKLETFLGIIFSRKIRDLLFEKSLISIDDVQNSRVLQSYAPLYTFNHWRIDNILSEKLVHPFRTTGPHLIDFVKGNWIYIPKITKYVVKLLKINKKSILISAESGTGKTVISRYVGYTFYKQNYTVFFN